MYFTANMRWKEKSAQKGNDALDREKSFKKKNAL